MHAEIICFNLLDLILSNLILSNYYTEDDQNTFLPNRLSHDHVIYRILSKISTLTFIYMLKFKHPLEIIIDFIKNYCKNYYSYK